MIIKTKPKRMNMHKKIFRIQKNEEGVSPVIGVILMVAITIAMAAIVSSWSAGIEAPVSPTTIGLDINRNVNNVSIVIASIDPISAAPLAYVNVSYMNSSGSQIGYRQNVVVGDSIDIDTQSPNPSRIIITATYKDNSKKVLYSQEI